MGKVIPSQLMCNLIYLKTSVNKIFRVLHKLHHRHHENRDLSNYVVTKWQRNQRLQN
ncbi:unknown [Salmonella phage FelixO1]|uniref:Uncharacterized protein n=1 Tax=Salmonella phage Felix O1 (isolate Felix O1-VT1) TaxID=1283336 RepID=Q6KGR0_BPFO1|nr:unknown [Salmonella phage FelixO1]